MKSREQFDVWFERFIGCNVNHALSIDMAEKYWRVWQASRSSIELNLTSEWDISSDGSRHYDADSVDEQLLALGIKVKK